MNGPLIIRGLLFIVSFFEPVHAHVAKQKTIQNMIYCTANTYKKWPHFTEKQVDTKTCSCWRTFLTYVLPTHFLLWAQRTLDHCSWKCSQMSQKSCKGILEIDNFMKLCKFWKGQPPWKSWNPKLFTFLQLPQGLIWQRQCVNVEVVIFACQVVQVVIVAADFASCAFWDVSIKKATVALNLKKTLTVLHTNRSIKHLPSGH